jgi:hypothetical protein
MYCVIQKVATKKANPYGCYKELLADKTTMTIGSVTRIKYGYKYSRERFERPIKDAYRISIHQSYREGGKIKKKQWVICTMSYYTLLDSWPGDCIRKSVLETKLLEMGITEKELWELVYEKLDPIIAQVKAEFEKTEEYQAKMLQKKQMKAWLFRKTLFEKSHGVDAYEFCYDFFNNLMDFDYERELELAFEEKKRKEREQNEQKYSNYGGNHDHSQYRSYFAPSHSNYTDKEKIMLKKIYRQLSKAFHPDITQDDGEIMKLINKLKEGWGI